MVTENRLTGVFLESISSGFRLRIIAGLLISARMMGRIERKNRLSFSKC
jgi:hypothetical protein